MSHSKRNTSRPDFTSHERSLLRNSWGSQRTRLTRDSYLPFGSCRLCLLPARNPVVACASNGDLFCRECAISDLLAQRKEIKRLEKEWEKEQDEKEEDKLREEESRRERELLEFERSYMNMERQNKRKRDDEVRSGRDSKRREFEDGEEKKADKSSSFWIPGSLATSERTNESTKPAKLHPICPASTSTNKHLYSLKTLITVSFTAEQDSQNKSTVLVCPSCKKALSNSAKAVLTKPCGHVICKPCTEQFMKLDERPDPHASEKQEIGVVRCYVCEADVTERKSKRTAEREKDKIRPGLIEISCEGTGFAGIGTNMAKKDGVAFLG